MSEFKQFVALIIATIFVSALSADNVNIALLSDGRGSQEIIPEALLKKEIKDLLEPQHQVTFVSKNGGWTEVGVNQALRDVLADTSIDIIITEGLVGTHIAGKIPSLNKPVVGMFVPEPRLQGLPLTQDKTSGKSNYTYISDLQNFDVSMEDIFKLLPNRKIGIVADQLIIDGVPMLADPNSEFYGSADIELIRVTDSVDEAIAKLPSGIGSLLIAPLPRFNRADMQKFAAALVDRKIVSVSFAGNATVQDGILMAVGTQPTETQKSARRVALNLLSILDGQKAENLSVEIQFGRSVQYNSDTAKAIGFELPWDLALLSEEFRSTDTKAQNKLNGMSLNDAVNIALERNLALEVQRLDLDIAGDDLLAAKSNWWPQLTLNAQVTQLDQDISTSVNPQGSVDANLGITQLIYSESVKSALDVAKLNQLASQYTLDAVALDTIRDVATAYLNVLRAQALADVQRFNLKASVQNLELSEDRFRLGAVTETDVLRWKSQIASDKQNLLSAQSDVNNAIVNLQTLLHQPIALNIVFDHSDVERIIAQTLHPEVRKIFDTPSLRNTMTDWILERGIINAPELKRTEILTAISSRQTRAAKRAFYVPDVNLSGQQSNNLTRYGSNADAANDILQEYSWNVGVVASYPLFQGRKRQADYAKAKRLQKQTALQTHQVKDGVRSSIWSAWNSLAASYPAIFLSQESADAAQRNLEMIRDQYSSGSINITTLIDVQNNALAAQLAAAQAEYTYLIDMVGFMRATSDFRFMTDASRSENWLKEFYQYKLEQEFTQDLK